MRRSLRVAFRTTYEGTRHLGTITLVYVCTRTRTRICIYSYLRVLRLVHKQRVSVAVVVPSTYYLPYSSMYGGDTDTQSNRTARTIRNATVYVCCTYNLHTYRTYLSTL